jgi:phosphonate transport system substrate-binding protein
MAVRRILLVLAFLAAAVPALPAAGEQDPLRIGLTAVVVRENLRFFDRWGEYLKARLGRPVIFVQRRAYRDIMDLLEKGELDVAWICGFPFVQKREPEFLELLAVPVYRGTPLYRSYIIVHQDSPYLGMEDLEGRIFAYSDPNSNSGYLVPRKVFRQAGLDPDRFFRLTFFTFSHAETVQAVADRVADAGAVDSYVWEFLIERRPELARQTRVIKRSETFGFPPIVARLGLDPMVRARIEAAFIGMKDDPEGHALLQELALDGFAKYPPDLYEPIRVLAEASNAMLRRTWP